MDKRMLTCKEVAERYGVKVQTVRTWIKNGTITGVKIGKSFFIDPNEVGKIESHAY